MNTNALIEIILKTIKIKEKNNMRLTFDKLELSYLVSFCQPYFWWWIPNLLPFLNWILYYKIEKNYLTSQNWIAEY